MYPQLMYVFIHSDSSQQNPQKALVKCVVISSMQRYPTLEISCPFLLLQDRGCRNYSSWHLSVFTLEKWITFNKVSLWSISYSLSHLFLFHYISSTYYVVDVFWTYTYSRSYISLHKYLIASQSPVLHKKITLILLAYYHHVVSLLSLWKSKQSIFSRTRFYLFPNP